MGDPKTSLVVIEATRSTTGAACGRLFAALGHDVTILEPPHGHSLRRRPHTFAALAAGKRSAIAGPAQWDEWLASADVLLLDLTPSEARVLGLDAETLARRHPTLVVVSLTAFDRQGELADLPDDSLLAEASGGLAHMVGEPGRAPLSLGGEQAAFAGAFVGLLGASLALRLRRGTGLGDVVEVATSDVIAYLDWKSDVTFELTGVAPCRTGASRGAWRVVEAKDGWVGVIFVPHQWPAVVQLIGDERLADPELLDPATRFARSEEIWPVISDAIRQREAHEVFVAAQRLGLPFGYAAAAADLFSSDQLRGRGFILPPEERCSDTPVVAFPLPGERSPAIQRAPALGERPGPAPRPNRRPLADAGGRAATSPLVGLVVLDFGTITAGAATGRILADYGATVIKVESEGRPDRFRQWVMPGSDASDSSGTSPMFESNNAGKIGVSLDLKTDAGREAVHELIKRADVLVENFRVGVTERMGIDHATAHELNPELVYLSLSSQGSHGPDSHYASYGSTLDLLSGLASATGYDDGGPLWSSGDVNYPDQVVALAGAAFVAHAVTTGRTGTWLDISQRELVAWTLADQLADFVWEGTPMTRTGNRRLHATPHDVYPTSDDGWVAVACSTDEQRRALADLIPGLADADDDSSWRGRQDAIDEILSEWTSTRRRDDAAAHLRAHGVPAVAVLTAGDRAAQAHRTRRRLALRAADGGWLKGFPMVMLGYRPAEPGPAPGLGADISGTMDRRFEELIHVVDTTTRTTHSGGRA
jgi:crotonobetainyl-CoA:carnitine CoA-transferase CaiB-like acyl-CoA transferase